MENILLNKLIKNRKIKGFMMIILCIVLISVQLFNSYIEVNAAMPLIIAGVAIAPEAITAGITLLVAAGITFSTQTDAYAAYEQFFIESGQNIREMLANLSGEIVSISDALWNAVKGWINTAIAEGINVGYNNAHYITDLDTGISYPFTVESDDLTQPIAPLESITWEGVTYELIVTEPNPPYIYFTCLENGEDVNGRTIADYGTQLVLCLLADEGGIKVSAIYNEYDYSNDTLGDLDLKHFDRLPGTHTNEIKNIVNGGGATPYNYTGHAIVNNPTYDFKTSEGVRTIRVPQSIDDIIGKTYEDVQNPVNEVIDPYSNVWEGSFSDCINPGLDWIFTGAGTLPYVIGLDTVGTWEGVWTEEEPKTWTGTFTDIDGNTWTGSAVGVPTSETGTGNIFTDIWEWLKNFWKTLGNLFTGLLAPIIAWLSTIAQSITNIRDVVIDDALNGKLSLYSLPQLILVILDILLACIRLIVRVIGYLGTITGIEASSEMLNSNAVSGLEFMKNQNIPVINISLWSVFSGVMSLVISLNVVKKVRNHV